MDPPQVTTRASFSQSMTQGKVLQLSAHRMAIGSSLTQAKGAREGLAAVQSSQGFQRAPMLGFYYAFPW